MHATVTGVGLVLLLEFAGFGLRTDGAAAPLFVNAARKNAPTAFEAAAGSQRERVARLDIAALDAARVAVGRGTVPILLLNLNLHDEDDYREIPVLITETEPTSTGYALFGRIQFLQGELALVVSGDIVIGVARLWQGRTSGLVDYSIVTTSDGEVAVRQVDATPRAHWGADVVALPPVGGRPVPSGWPLAGTPPRDAAALPAGGREDAYQIDVLVVYTPRARRSAGGHRRIEAAIDLHAALVNQAFRESDVAQRMRVVHTAEVRYNERGRSASTILHHLAEVGDGYMDRVHALRNRYAADIVSLQQRPEPGARGPAGASQQTWLPAHEGRAFNVVPFFSNGSEYNHYDAAIFAHELGHNMGLSHDRYQLRYYPDRYSPGTVEPHPYSVGYVNQPGLHKDSEYVENNGRGWYTIMAYPKQCWDRQVACEYLLRFSNPHRAYSIVSGLPRDPGGVPGTKHTPSVTGPADARRSLNRTRRAVANWRIAPCLRSGDGVRLQASNGRHLVALGNGGGEVVADRPRPSPWGRFTVVDRNGGCVESGDVVSLRTSDGFYLRARRGGGLGLDATAPRPTPWARFVVHRERTRRPAVRIHDTIALQAQSGHYVVAEEGGGGRVNVDRTSVDLWSRFRLTAFR